MSREIKLSKGYKAIVDDEDYEELSKYKWCCNIIDGKYPHAERKIKNKNIKSCQKAISISRQIMKAPKGMIVDHMNHNTLDNQRCNLRICTNAENIRNQIRQKRKTSSIYKGVYRSKNDRKWRSKIKFNSKEILLGSFKTEIGAACMYNMAARKYFGEFANLNIITNESDKGGGGKQTWLFAFIAASAQQ